MSNSFGFVYDLETITFGHILKINLKRNFNDGVLFSNNDEAKHVANVTLK